MGTRNLTVVKSNNDIKVAQYGQWDGYPDGVGYDIVNFIVNNDLEKFKEKVDKLEFFTQEEINEINESEGNPFETYPYLSRDLGGKILHAIMHGEYIKPGYEWRDEEDTVYEFEIEKLVNSVEFGTDSLFCEWAYVIDLDERELVVYKGFQKEPHSEGIFVEYMENPNEPTATVDDYFACKPIATFDLDNPNLKNKFTEWTDLYNKEMSEA